MCEEKIKEVRRAFAARVERDGLYHAVCHHADIAVEDDTELLELVDAFYLDGQRIEKLLEESAKLKPFRDIK